MAKTKAQTEYAQNYFKGNPKVKKLWMNPQGEFFTDINWANNSLQKDATGKVKGKLEIFQNEEPATDEGAATTGESGTGDTPGTGNPE